MSIVPDNGRLGLLFLGGAKRVAVGRMFEHACRERGLGCEITGYELDRHCPLAAIGDVVEGLRWSDPAIFDTFDQVTDAYGIDIVIPFVDPAVGIAARYAAMNHYGHEIFSPVSSHELATRMFDKCAAADLFEQLGLPIPATHRPGELFRPLIAKPRYGSASKGLVFIDSPKKLREVETMTDRYLIQERIDNRSEITVDCYVGVHDGCIYAVSPRVRLEVSGGESVRTLTVDDPEAVDLACHTLEATGLRGAVTVQLIRDLDSGRLMVMEINPRLGGGVVASVHAGADIPALIIGDALGEELSHLTPQPGVLVTRYLDDVVFYPEN
ncbi:MAG: ATP-grasp domain-containing protein [Bacteroidales bacterium]|nr:ATP-grasp domain-containing protein [Bacteroidales bacterium]